MADLQRVEDVVKLPERARDAHKGTFGRVLVVGGSRGMTGAVAMACDAALRGGAGLVSFAAPEIVQLTIAALAPCATSIALACEPDGSILADAARQVSSQADRFAVLAVGPGMGVGAAQRDLVQAAIALDKPLVVDADGLNNLARLEGWARQRACPLVLTPHPGEFARLTGKSVGEIQSDRENVAVQAARQWAGESEPSDAAPLVCVLKGAGTVVTDGERIYRNDTGNPGMASGGSGDILTGLTAALLGQGLEPFDAACLAVWAHGLAGDIAAEMLGEVSLMGWDLLDALPEAMKQAVEERD